MVNINLLPPENKLKIKQAKQSANIFSICLVAVIILVVLGFILKTLKNDLLGPDLENIQKQIEAQKTELSSYNELENQALLVNDRGKLSSQIESQKASWSQILQDLINDVPTNVQVTTLTADLAKSPNFVLQGTTDSDRDAIKFKDKLENSAFFKDVSFKSSSTAQNQTPGSSSQKLSFTLEFNLEQKSLNQSSSKGVK
jgi:Tfp pilus assembly protein PilN